MLCALRQARDPEGKPSVKMKNSRAVRAAGGVANP